MGSITEQAWPHQMLRPSTEFGFSGRTGATYTNMTAATRADARDKLIQPEVMQAPVVWLASEASNGFNGQCIIAYFWDERVPIAERLQQASAPAAWPQLGRQAIVPG